MGLKLKSTGGTGSVELNCPDNHNINTSFTLPTSNFTGGEWVLADGSGNVNIDSGKLLVGTTSSSSTSTVTLQGNSGSSTGPSYLNLGRGGLPDSSVSGLGYIRFEDNSGNLGAQIQGIADGAWTSGSNHRSRLVFSTTADGASSPTERMRIDSSGNVGIGESSPSAGLHVVTDVNPVLKLDRGSANTANANWYYNGTLTGQISAANADFQLSAAGASTPISFYANGSQRMRIDSSGRLLVGTQTAFQVSNIYPNFQVGGTTDLLATACIFNSNNNASSPKLLFGKDRGGAVVTNNDGLGGIFFSGRDNSPGDVNVTSAKIESFVDGTVSTNTVPTRLVFSTASGFTANERMRITSQGYLKASNNGTYNSTSGTYHELRNNVNNIVTNIQATNTSYTNVALQVRCWRGNNSAFSLIKTYSNNASDLEHHLRGDGNAYADGSWNGGGADYAEYFEWSDGNTAAEDRRGISVVLDGDKIRAAVDGEEPIGVISGNPSVVGDADMERWKEKYLRDDFGTYIREDCEVEDEDGNTVVQQCRVLNPEYDPDQEYVSREDRPEWDTVGLMGKLRIRKGQVTGSRWIKMRDISDTVEEWLVR